MHTRRLGPSDLQITSVGIGTWAMGGAAWERGWGAQHDRDSIDAILRALDLGINWIDTAAVYGLGHAETVVARALAEWRGPRPLVFTKCGLWPDASGRVARQLTPASIRWECEQSLARLRVDCLDLYQVHRPPDELAAIDAAMDTLAALVREGKVRHVGVSNFTVEQLARARAVMPVASVQPPYSLIDRGIEADVLPYCQQHGIGVIVYSPMGCGLLSGAMTRERLAALPADDWRRTDPAFTEPLVSRHLAVADELRTLGQRCGRGTGEMAVAWTLRHPGVTGAIVGVRSAAQVDGVMRAGEMEPDVWAVSLSA